jgi:hypothetical protein
MTRLVKEKIMPRPRVRHELKYWPEFFQPTLNGHKRFELRRDDRPEGFQVGDELLLKEWDSAPACQSNWDDKGHGHIVTKPKGYTGREVLVRVDYVMPAAILNGLMDRTKMVEDFVIMSVSRI